MRFLALSYFDVQAEGSHHIPPTGPAIVIPNHPTWLDPFLVGWGTRRWVTWLAWDEAFDWPAIGAIMKSMGAVPLSLERAAPQSLKTAYSILRAERLLGIFFEGKRTAASTFQLTEPVEGAARIALRTGAPIVPVSLAGARRLWPRERAYPSRGPIRVRYHAPISPDAGGSGSQRARGERLTRLVAEAICSGLPEDGRHSHFGESRVLGAAQPDPQTGRA